MKILLLGFWLLIGTHCGGGGLYTATGASIPDESTSQGEFPGPTITTGAFYLANEYPACLQEFDDTLFVVNESSPAGVIAIDSHANPLQTSPRYANYTAPAGTGIANKLLITAAEAAYLLTSSHVIVFNPATGDTLATISVTDPITPPQTIAFSEPYDSDGDGNTETGTNGPFTPSYPSDLLVVDNHLYVASSNYLSVYAPIVGAQGTIQGFKISTDSPYLMRAGVIVTSGYNLTSLAAFMGDIVLAAHSGLIAISDTHGVPITESKIDFISLSSESIQTTLALGKAGISFHPIQIPTDSQYGYVASATFPSLYQIDLENRTVVRGLANPIGLSTTRTYDFMADVVLNHDGQILYVSSFDQAKIFPVLIADPEDPVVIPAPFTEPFNLAIDDPTGANTGVGDMVVTEGVGGSDLWALTGNPGTVSLVQTYDSYVTGTAEGSWSGETQIATLQLTGDLTLSVGDTEILSLTVTMDDGSIYQGITDVVAGIPVSWWSSRADIASVSGEGRITALAAGKAVIFAQAGDVTSYLAFTVAENDTDEAHADGTSSDTDDSGANDTDPNDDGNTEETPARSCVPGLPDDADAYADAVASYTPGSGVSAAYSDPAEALGGPTGGGAGNGSLDVVSLGTGGAIILAFTDSVILEGEGIDLIVFENPFVINAATGLTFSEPGRVSVSQDGVNFYSFDCDTSAWPYAGCAGVAEVYANIEEGISATDPDVAGGDPFDLADVGLDWARYVKIEDLGLGYASGFDLDAMAIVNAGMCE